MPSKLFTILLIISISLLQSSCVPTYIQIYKSQIRKHWKAPFAALQFNEIKTIVYVSLNKDGNIKEVKIKEVICPKGAESACKLFAESAEKAIWKASPFKNLPEE